MGDLAKDKHKQEPKETLFKVLVSNLVSLLKIFLVCSILVYLTVNYAVRPIHVRGGSMYPTLKEGDFGFSNAFSAKFQDIHRGDIVVVYERKQTRKFWVKRVIGLPGDRISCHKDTVYVNGVPLEEPYLDNDFAQNIRETNLVFTDDFDEEVLGEDEYWVMGDNRIISFDSRDHGPFEREDIRGVQLFVAFPFNRIKVTD